MTAPQATDLVGWLDRPGLRGVMTPGNVGVMTPIRVTPPPYRGEIPPEPHRMGARVRDAEGDTWRRGRTRWTCEAAVDGHRVSSVARMRWNDLVRAYGPIQVVDLNDRKS